MTATEAFLGGTAQNPAVMIQNTDQGLYKVNIWTGEVEWIIPAKGATDERMHFLCG